MERVIQSVTEQHPEFELKLGSFHFRTQPLAVFTILHQEYAEAALSRIAADYETRMKLLDGHKEQLLTIMARLSDKPQHVQQIHKNIQELDSPLTSTTRLQRTR
ncbi:MAG: hypothetical protein HQK58_09360 [Deltaproteobacteria bacterium]|nr:hypothetical protein [Deltaproteobacteria bacterium]